MKIPQLQLRNSAQSAKRHGRHINPPEILLPVLAWSLCRCDSSQLRPSRSRHPYRRVLAVRQQGYHTGYSTPTPQNFLLGRTRQAICSSRHAFSSVQDQDPFLMQTLYFHQVGERSASSARAPSGSSFLQTRSDGHGEQGGQSLLQPSGHQ